MNVVIVDSSLRHHSGHCYQYSTAVAEALKRKVTSVRIAGNISAASECLAVADFVPHFSMSVAQPIGGRSIFAKLRHGLKAVMEFVRDLDALCAPHLRDKNGVHCTFFVHTFREYEFVAWAIWALRRSVRLRKADCTFLFVMRFSYIRTGVFRSGLSALLYLISGVLLRVSLSRRAQLLTDSELLAIEYRRLLRTTVTVIPIPIAEKTSTYFRAESVRKTSRWRVAYVGGLRHQKGFDLFVDVVASEHQVLSRLLFFAQLDVGSITEKERTVIGRSVRKLMELAEHRPVEIAHGALAEQQYYRAIADSDIICLPYRAENYRAATSGILVEAVLLGKIPIVTGGNWLSFELSRNGLDGLVIEGNSCDAILAALDRVTSRYQFWQGRVLALREKWARYHNADALASMLISASRYDRNVSAAHA